jgi:hypothetical protein
MDMEKLTIYQLKTISGGERERGRVLLDLGDMRGSIFDVAKDPQVYTPPPRGYEGNRFITPEIDLAKPLIKKLNNKRRSR